MSLEPLEDKEKHLLEILSKMENVLLGFTGGVDSTYLLHMAKMATRGKVLAVTAISPIHPLREIEEAKEIAAEEGVTHIFVESKELENTEFRSNPPHRCYLCRKMLYSHFRELALDKGFTHILNGNNKNDEEKARPGMRAALEYGVRSPLQEANLFKSEIRELSQKAGLRTWKKPSLPCLVTRFNYGEHLTISKLEQVERSEEFLRLKGFRRLRVRYNGDTARIELDSHMLQKAVNMRKEIAFALQKFGFTYVTLDLCSSMESRD